MGVEKLLPFVWRERESARLTVDEVVRGDAPLALSVVGKGLVDMFVVSWIEERTPKCMADSGTGVASMRMHGSNPSWSSIAEASHIGHSPAGIASPGWTRSQAFSSGPHRSAGPFQPQYRQVAVGIMP